MYGVRKEKVSLTPRSFNEAKEGQQPGHVGRKRIPGFIYIFDPFHLIVQTRSPNTTIDIQILTFPFYINIVNR